MKQGKLNWKSEPELMTMNDETMEFDPQEDEDLKNEHLDLNDPFDPREIDIQVQQTTMDNLIKRLAHDEIDLNPDFQRSADLWKNDIKGRLIESLLIRFPIPAFYFDASDEDKWVVVDGLQRLTTIKRFVVDKSMKLKGLEFIKDCDGMVYEDLSRTLKRRIDEAPVTLYLIKPGTPLHVKFSLFYRINTGGLALNPQEIRHALSQSVNNAQASNFLKKIAEMELFKTCVRVSDKRMLDKELILRYVAFKLHNYKTYKEPMIKFLNDAMMDLGNVDKAALLRIENELTKALSLSWNLFGDNAFRKSIVENTSRKIINRALFETLTTVLSSLSEEQIKSLLNNKENFVRDYIDLLKESEFDRAITVSTTYSDNIIYRFTEIGKLVRRHSQR